jgi:small-conductance mechanosensitive channel
MDPYSTQLLMLNQVQQLSGAFVEHIRSILFALAFIVLGLVCAEVAKYLSRLLLRWLRWEPLSARMGLTSLLGKYRPDVTPVTAAAEAVFWFTLLCFGMQALVISDFAPLLAWGQAYFDFLPSAGQAVVALLVGWWLAGVLGRLVLRLREHALTLLVSGLVRVLVLGVCGYYALSALGLDQDFIRPLVLIACAGAVLALAWPGSKRPVYREIIRVN